MQQKWLIRLHRLIDADRAEEFYWTYTWKKFRKQRRELDNNECQRCKRLGRYTEAQMVHHKKPLKEYPHLALSIFNTESLCNACHNLEHPEKMELNKKRFENKERW